MSTPGFVIIFVGLFCLISAASTFSGRQKRQTIFFEDEVDASGSRNQGTGGASHAGKNEWLSRDTQKPHLDAFAPPDFEPPAFGTSSFQPQWESNRHFGEEHNGNLRGLDYTHKHGFNGGNPHHFHFPLALKGHYPQFHGPWNQNQRGWNDIGNSGNGPDWDRPNTWLGNGQNNNGGAWNGDSQRPNGDGRGNGAWNQNWSGNLRPGGNGNNGNNGAWSGNQNNGGSWNANNPNSWNNNGGSWTGNNNRPTQIPAGNNGNFGNSIVPPFNNNNRPRPGGNNGSIRPPISINGARPPSTPAPNCSCPSTNETNPVCGDNGVTYVNPSRLRCARVCGSSVQQKHYGACTATTPATNFRRG